MSFEPADNPDGREALRAGDLAPYDWELAARLNLEHRIFRMYGRCWLAGRGLALNDTMAVLDAGGPELGLHISQLARGPTLEEWLAWPRLREVRHLSFNSAFLGGRGAEQFLNTEVGDLQTLDLSVCDIGLKGLRCLQASQRYPSLSELYLHSNDSDRTKWNAKAVSELLLDSEKKPRGESLKGLRKLGLMFWKLADAMAQLEASPLIAGLEELWIWDRYYDPPRWFSNLEALPESLRSKTVVGWERTPAAGG